MRNPRNLLIPLLAFALAIVPSCAAQEYYADVTLVVSGTGSVSVSGISNHPMLAEGSYDAYTSKNGEYWVLNITTGDAFSDYVYTVLMPPGSAINYIKSSGRISIRHDGDTIKLEGYGNGDELMIVVQYSMVPSEDTAQCWPAAVLLVPAAAALVLYVRRRSRTPGKPAYDPSLLSGRQLAIVQALEKNGKPMTQRQLEETLGLPKSSVSRNIASLVRAGILVKHSRGMSNAVWFAAKGGK